jgi:hypothetical protein
VNSDRVEVDELILEIADYKNDLADMAAEKLFKKCSSSWQAYQYLQDRGRKQKYFQAFKFDFSAI